MASEGNLYSLILQMGSMQRMIFVLF